MLQADVTFNITISYKQSRVVVPNKALLFCEVFCSKDILGAVSWPHSVLLSHSWSAFAWNYPTVDSQSGHPVTLSWWSDPSSAAAASASWKSCFWGLHLDALLPCPTKHRQAWALAVHLAFWAMKLFYPCPLYRNNALQCWCRVFHLLKAKPTKPQIHEKTSSFSSTAIQGDSSLTWQGFLLGPCTIYALTAVSLLLPAAGHCSRRPGYLATLPSSQEDSSSLSTMLELHMEGLPEWCAN